MFKEKIQNYFGSMTLHRRLLAYFIIVGLVPLITIGSFSIAMSISSSRTSAIEFSDATLLQVKTRIDVIMDVADTISLQLADDTIVQNTLRKPPEVDIAKKYATDLSMDTYLNSELTYIEELYGFYIIGKSNSKYKSAYNSFRDGNLTDTIWYNQVMSSETPIWFSSHKDSQAVLTSGQSFVSRGIRIKDKASSDYLGIILVDIELEIIEKILLDSFGDLGQVMIIDERNEIVASSGNIFDNGSDVVAEAIQLTEDISVSNITAPKSNAILLSQQLKNNDWRMVGLIPSDIILKDSLISVTVLLGLILVIIILTYLISKQITSTITGPVNNMTELMKEVESGNLDVYTDVRYEDEIGILSQSFNRMTLQVKNLMQKSVEEQHKLRKYELKALQSQINPHFLYNTLDSVVWLARMEQYEDIVNIVSAMTKLFRISLSRGKDIITVEEEVEHVRNYLLIQKFRYRTHFDFIIDIPDEISGYKTLKLILQPLVENAIYHGLKVKRDGGTIDITAEETEDRIIFKVIDTGVGMDKDTLEAIHDAFRTRSETSVTMYGIRNVNERIEIFFGKEYGLRFESTYGQGTTAIIEIPKYTA